MKKMKKTRLTKIMSILFAIMLVMGTMSISVYADEDTGAGENGWNNDAWELVDGYPVTNEDTTTTVWTQEGESETVETEGEFEPGGVSVETNETTGQAAEKRYNEIDELFTNAEEDDFDEDGKLVITGTEGSEEEGTVTETTTTIEFDERTDDNVTTSEYTVTTVVTETVYGDWTEDESKAGVESREVVYIDETTTIEKITTVAVANGRVVTETITKTIEVITMTVAQPVAPNEGDGFIGNVKMTQNEDGDKFNTYYTDNANKDNQINGEEKGRVIADGLTLDVVNGNGGAWTLTSDGFVGYVTVLIKGELQNGKVVNGKGNDFVEITVYFDGSGKHTLIQDSDSTIGVIESIIPSTETVGYKNEITTEKTVNVREDGKITSSIKYEKTEVITDGNPDLPKYPDPEPPTPDNNVMMIMSENVPLANLPEDVVLAILDEEVPLADIPQTGADTMGFNLAMLGLSLSALAAMMFTRKKETVNK
jgi:LPXTG-motif cell wall-anchored protein